VNWLKEKLRAIWDHPRIQRIFKDSSWLFSSNMVTMVLGIVQSSLSARLLGVYNFGLLGVITNFASTINNLFSFRMGEVVVKYLGDFLEEQNTAKAGALVKAAALIEAVFATLAFIFLCLVAPLGARLLVKDMSFSGIFIFYGTIILANMFYETSFGVIQVLGLFKGQAVINSIQSAVTALIIVFAFIAESNLEMIVFAYFMGKLILGISPIFLAINGLNRKLGRAWWKAPLREMPEWREMLHFGIGSNLSATVNMIVRDSELLWVSYFLSPAEAGYYKVAVAINRYILLPINPFIQTTYPEINKYIKNKLWKPLRSFLRKITTVSALWTMGCVAGLIVFGKLAIRIYAGNDFVPAYSAMLILLVGYGIANIFFWNRSLLLSFGDSLFAFVAMLIAGLLKIFGGFVLVPQNGYLAEAVLFSLFFVLSVMLNLGRGLFRLRQAEKEHPQSEIVEGELE
jgi:O-antigen/teichoic acid export membrane protein